MTVTEYSPFTKVFRKDTYSSIDPTLPALSAAGKTILITGGASGVGEATALGFASAGASRLVLVARSTANLEKVKEKLNKASPSTKVEIFSTDITDVAAVDTTFKAVRVGGEIDVVVLSAATSPAIAPGLTVEQSVLENSIKVNFNGNLNVVKAYLSTGDFAKKTIINITSNAVQMAFAGVAIYAASKLMWTHFLRHIYEENKAEGLSVFQVHPGSIFTGLAEGVGITADMFDFDQVALPGNFNVWLASPEAQFLNGKYVWATWDVEELKARKEEILANPTLLTLNLEIKQDFFSRR